MKRVAIIGAGPSGLAVMIAFQHAQLKGENIPEIVCFEKQEDWGGLWNYTWRTSVDEYGDTIHNSMYKNLWTNAPKECIEFSDYTFMDHFEKAIPSFVPRAVIRDYIVGRACKFEVRKFIKFGMRVESVVRLNDKFIMNVWNKKENCVFSNEFDYVVVANGHFSVPYIPEIEGMDTFPGHILHSHEFREAEQFKGKNVVVLGSSHSAEDVSLQCWKYGSKSVTIGYRHAPLGLKWPEGIKEKHCLERIEGKTFFFKDGYQQTADSLILCSGYLHSFPFMDDSLKLKTPNTLYCAGLYKGVVWQNDHNLFYLGMQDQVYSFQMFDAQAWFARDTIMGNIVVPSEIEIKKDIDQWISERKEVRNFYDRADFQAAYVEDLLKHIVGFPKTNLESLTRIFKLKYEDKRMDVIAFRNNSYSSTVTSTEATPPITKWLDAMEVTIESFLDAK